MEQDVVRYAKYVGKGPNVVAGVYMDKAGKVYRVDLSHAKLERLLDASIAKGDVVLVKGPDEEPEPEVQAAEAATPEAKPKRARKA